MQAGRFLVCAWPGCPEGTEAESILVDLGPVDVYRSPREDLTPKLTLAVFRRARNDAGPTPSFVWRRASEPPAPDSMT